MRVAFTSCMSAQLYPDQPVWDRIREHAPDFLVLLGDSVYLDFGCSTHPMELEDDEFARHAFSLYEAQLHQVQFQRLVSSLPENSVFSIWDDHDFLWNDVCGGELRSNPQFRQKIALTTNLQEAFRKTLASGLRGETFPNQYSDPNLWSEVDRLNTPSVALSENTVLHLLDVRSFRTRTWLVRESSRTVLGAEQRTKIEDAVASRPNAIHLLASGSTIADWKWYERDTAWLFGLARTHRCMVMSGDIHRNDIDAFYTRGFPLHEVTSSGAAVRDAVVVGARRENFGLLDISAEQVHCRFFSRGAIQSTLSRDIARDSWLPK